MEKNTIRSLFEKWAIDYAARTNVLRCKIQTAEAWIVWQAAFEEMQIELKTTQQALASSLETNQALSKNILAVKMAGCSAMKWMYSEIKSKKDSDENNYNPFVGLYDLLYGDKK